MANNEEISQEVKVEETQSVSAENQSVATEEKTEKGVKAKEDKKADKPKKKKKDKKPSKIAKSLKETSSELKKVTWPKFGEVVKKTGIVLAVTAAFLLVVFGLDRLCSWLIGLIVNKV